jgi:V/A-type H+-transporting ATPase subunit D
MAVLPTKGNLIATKHSLELATTGYELMDRKRNILTREMMSLISKAEELQSRIDSTFTEAYDALMLANITMGKTIHVVESIPVDESLEIRYRSVMGVEIPTVMTEQHSQPLEYGLSVTNSAMDDALIKFHRVKELICELAEMENTIYRLAFTIKKTQKRANALRNIVIPGYNETITLITEALEEKEREEFARLKVIKAQKNA